MSELFFAAGLFGEHANVVAHEKNKSRAALLYEFLSKAATKQIAALGTYGVPGGSRVPVTAQERRGSDINQLDWDRAWVPTRSYVYPHEWLLFQKTGKVPVLRTMLSTGYTIIPATKMPEVLHEVVEGFHPNTNYATLVTWTHSIKEHCPSFTESLFRALQPWPELDKVRAVFWLA